jgi:hypothetical protein
MKNPLIATTPDTSGTPRRMPSERRSFRGDFLRPDDVGRARELEG